MSLGYAYEKMTVALNLLATGTGTIQQRLHDAYLGFHTLRTNEDFPADLRADYNRLEKALTEPKRPETDPTRARDVGKAKVACEQLSDDEGRELATLIVHLQYEVRVRHEDARSHG